MTHDENVYPDPFAFIPERYFDEKGELNNDDRVLAFGFGRRYFLSNFSSVNSFSQQNRVCVGEHVASATVSTSQIFSVTLN